MLLVGWLGAAVAVGVLLPGLSSGSALSGILSTDSPAVRAELTSADHFAVPLLAQALVVQYDASGLPASVQSGTVADALSFDRDPPADLARVAGALPLTDTLGVFASSPTRNTTAITFLFFHPSVSISDEHRLAERYAHHYFSYFSAPMTIWSG